MATVRRARIEEERDMGSAIGGLGFCGGAGVGVMLGSSWGRVSSTRRKVCE